MGSHGLKSLIKRLFSHPEMIMLIIMLGISVGYYIYAGGSENIRPGGDIQLQVQSFGFLMESIRAHGELPFWTPYDSGGVPFYQNLDYFIFSPITIPALLSKNIYQAINIAFALTLFLSFWGMYLFIRGLGGSKGGSILSASIYAFSGSFFAYFSNNMTSTFPYAFLPFFYLFLYKAFHEKGALRNSLLAAFFYSLLLHSGNSYLFIHNNLLILLFFLYHAILNIGNRERLKKLFGVGLIVIIVFLGLAAVRLLPALEYNNLLIRSSLGVDFEEFNEDTDYSLLNLFVPSSENTGSGPYIGVVATLLVLLSLGGIKRKKRLFFIMATLVFIIISLRFEFVMSLFYNYFPGFKYTLSVSKRIGAVTAFLLSVLAYYGYQSVSKILREKIDLKKAKAILAILVILPMMELMIFDISHLGQAVNPPHKDQLSQHEQLGFVSQDNDNFRVYQKLPIVPEYIIGNVINKGISPYAIFFGLKDATWTSGNNWMPDYIQFLLALELSENPAKIGSILNIKYITSKEELGYSGLKLKKKFDDCNCTWLTNKKENYPYLYQNELHLPVAYKVKEAILIVGNNNLSKDMLFELLLTDEYIPSHTVIIKTPSIDKIGERLDRFDMIVLSQKVRNYPQTQLIKDYVRQGGKLYEVYSERDKIEFYREVLPLLNKTDKYLPPKIEVEYDSPRKVRIHGPKSDSGFIVISEKFHLPGWETDKNSEIYEAYSVISSIYHEGDSIDYEFIYTPPYFTAGAYISLSTFVIILFFLGYDLMRRRRG